MRGFDLIAPFHLPSHQLAVCMHQKLACPEPLRFFQTSDERFIFRDIVGRLPNSLADLSEGFAVGILHQYPNSRRAGVAFTGTINEKYELCHLLIIT